MSSNNVRGTLKYVVRHVAKAFGLAAYEVEEVLFEEPNLSLVSAFLGADAQLPAARFNCDHYGPAANRLLAQCGSRLWPRLEPEDPLVCLIAS